MLYKARAEFHVGSRIPWTDRESELRDHLDEVVAQLRQQPAVGEVVVDGNPQRSWVAVEVVFHAPKENEDPAHDVKLMLSQAISKSGAMIDGLLSLAEEARVKPNQNAWWGLRTPRWSARAFRLEVVPET
jgi:hypothetical protein